MLRTWAWRTGCAAALTVAALAAATPTYAATTPGSTGLVAAARSAPATGGVAVRATGSGWAHTISGMASHLCGRSSEVLWERIADENGIVDRDRIRLGQVIIVRCTAATQATPPAPATPTQPKAATTGWVAPLAGLIACGGPGGRFGADRGNHSHAGIDLSRPTGTRIRAVHAGTVKLVRYQAGGAGNYVMLAHSGGTYTVYMHMVRRSFLKVGQHVTAGQTIGYVGSTGHSSGPHLHFEVHAGAWHQVNPAPFLRARGITVRGC